MAGDAVLLDTNILLTATAPARPLHREALTLLQKGPPRDIPLWISPQIVREYLVVATRPAQVNGLGLTPAAALDNIEQFRGRLVLLKERDRVLNRLLALIREFEVAGKQIHDANLVATALVHGAGRILTLNPDDFQRFASRIEITPFGERPWGSLLP
jgi:predicted nucleic acid-binding protein